VRKATSTTISSTTVYRRQGEETHAQEGGSPKRENNLKEKEEADDDEGDEGDEGDDNDDDDDVHDEDRGPLKEQ